LPPPPEFGAGGLEEDWIMGFGRFGLVLGMAWVMGAGCTVTSETTPPPGLPYPDETTFCQKLAEAVCNATVVTLCYSSSAQSLPADTQSCVAAYRAQSHCNPGGLGYHPDGAEACLAAVQTMYTDAVVESAELKAVEEACVTVFFAGGAMGSCQSPTSVGGGSSCAAPNAVCVAGFYCFLPDAYCREMPGQGDACSATDPCTSQNVCSATTGGVCELKAPNGAVCAADADCQSGFCTMATSAIEGVCTATSALSITSSSCDLFRP
jgi:hypothetical protein